MPLTQIQKAFEMAFGDPEKDKAIKIVLEV
jgi:hypothetical protein